MEEVLRESELCITNVLRCIKAGEAELKRARMTGATFMAPSLNASVTSIASLDEDEFHVV